MTTNDRFWHMVWLYRPELKGFDPITTRANAQSPRELFASFNAYAPAEKTNKGLMAKVAGHFRKDPTKLSDAAKAQLHINAVMLDDTFIYLYALTGVLRRRFNAVSVQYAPPKGLIRSEEKIVVDTSRGGYGGDASQLKDQVRCTIVCKQALDGVSRSMDAICSEVNGLRLPKNKLNAHVKSTGYSDLNTVVLLPNGMYAEIQFNSLLGLYGKNSRQDWLEGTGQGIPEYTRLARQIGVDGGYGHQLYEISRNSKNPKAVRDRADELAIAYYGHIMKAGAGTGKDLNKQVADFIRQHLGGHGGAGEVKVPAFNEKSPYQFAIYSLMEQQFQVAGVWKSDLSV